jgi:hypothetical protein
VTSDKIKDKKQKIKVEMMKALNINEGFLKLLFLVTVLFFCVNSSFAQPALPQRTLTVTSTQSIHFGTFCISGGAGGTVTVGYDGSRSSLGDIILLSMSPTAQPAIFEIKLCQGRNVIITFDATITLTGSNGGSLTLDIGPTEKGGNSASFTTNNDCNFITPLRMGGTLHVPGTAIPGTYTGSFDITFNQE